VPRSRTSSGPTVCPAGVAMPPRISPVPHAPGTPHPSRRVATQPPARSAASPPGPTPAGPEPAGRCPRFRAPRGSRSARATPARPPTRGPRPIPPSRAAGMVVRIPHSTPAPYRPPVSTALRIPTASPARGPWDAAAQPVRGAAGVPTPRAAGVLLPPASRSGRRPSCRPWCRAVRVCARRRYQVAPERWPVPRVSSAPRVRSPAPARPRPGPRVAAPGGSLGPVSHSFVRHPVRRQVSPAPVPRHRFSPVRFSPVRFGPVWRRRERAR
jgi:hypothetical protein